MKKDNKIVMDLEAIANAKVAKLSDHKGLFYDTLVEIKKTNLKRIKYWFTHLFKKK